MPIPPHSSKGLRTAIERLRSNLPELVGANYSAFEAELDSLLQEGSDDKLLDLFDRYPAAREGLKGAYLRLITRRFVNLVVAASGSYQLLGDPIYHRLDKTLTYYYCTFGQHEVDSKDVLNYDNDLKALCPIHQEIMIFRGSRKKEK